MKFKTYFTILLFLIICSSVFSQALLKIADSPSMNMKISGTSTFHNWSMNSKLFTGSALFNLKKDNYATLVSIKSLTFAIEVTNLKSEESALDKNAYKALKTEQ